MKKLYILLLLAVLVILSCTNLEDDIPPESDGGSDTSLDTIEILEDTDTVKETDTEEVSICDVYCKTNEDCSDWNGICILAFDGYATRTICSSSCSAGKPCDEEGFFCLPLTKGGLKFNWQCVPVDGPLCQGEN